MRQCVIQENAYGSCKTRINVNGKLYTRVYGNLSALESRPIEIKPFFHFYPGSTALTFATWSCNFKCPWCQNYHLSKVKPPLNTNPITPWEIVKIALSNKDLGICVSFNEPTLLFEFALDTFKLAKKSNLYNSFVSNGYLSSEALKLLKKAGLDAINIDIKGNEMVYEKFCGGVSLDHVWATAKLAKKLGIHVEIINLVITNTNDGLSDLEAVIERHIKEVGVDTPLHFTRYYPSYKFFKSRTKIETLVNAYTLAKKHGILYPYLGNVPGHIFENTYCHNCGKLLIKRDGFTINYVRISSKNTCLKCGTKIPIVGSIQGKKISERLSEKKSITKLSTPK
jgi:pyruvate formate lyase activating enzyme